MIRIVVTKELRDHARDVRSVIGALVLPVLGPLIVLLLFLFVADLQRERPLHGAASNQDRAPLLIDYLTQHGARLEPAPKDPQLAVREGDFDFVLLIEADYDRRLASGRSAPVRVVMDASNYKAQQSVRRIEQLLFAYSQQLATQRLIVRGLSPELARPLELDEVDVATPERLASDLLNVIPLFLMLAALVGGMNVAIDTTAGERERGSLEPLLLTPAPRTALVVGKWLATSIAAALVAVVTLVVFVVSIAWTPFEEVGLRVSLGAAEALLMLVALLPLAFFGAALQMLVATFARTFKEAQTYLNLLNLLPMVPSLLLMLSPGSRQWWMTLVPTVAQVTTVVDILRGEEVGVVDLSLIWMSSALLASLCLYLLVRLLARERIVFGR